MKDKNYILFALNRCEDAINNNLESMFVGSEEGQNELIEYHVNKDQYKGFMDILLDYAVEEEEFELCEKIIDTKNRLIEKFNL
jgi:hypothetical protein